MKNNPNKFPKKISNNSIVYKKTCKCYKFFHAKGIAKYFKLGIL